MAEVKVNIGRMVAKMELLKPVSGRGTSGEIVYTYECVKIFLSDIISQSNEGDRPDEMLPGKLRINFVASCFYLETDWKIKHNDIMYDIDKIEMLERGRFGMYECSAAKLKKNG